MPNSINWINVGILLANIGVFAVLAWTLWYTNRTYRYTARSYDRQAWSLDYSSYLDLMTRFSQAWRRYQDAHHDHKRFFECCELLGLLEVGCLLWRCGTIEGDPKKILEENLKDDIENIANDRYVQQNMCKIVSRPQTLIEMERFAQKHSINFPELGEARKQAQKPRE